MSICTCDYHLKHTQSFIFMNILKPIPSKLQYYNSTNEADRDMRIEHQRQWNQIFHNLKTLFRAAVDEAWSRRLVTKEFKNKFYTSGGR